MTKTVRLKDLNLPSTEIYPLTLGQPRQLTQLSDCYTPRGVIVFFSHGGH